TMFVSNSSAVNNYMFYGCTKLKDVVLDYITEIPDYAFYECDALVSIKLTQADGRNLFDNQITSIGNYAFYGADNFTYPLTEATAKNTLITSIGWFAFANIAKIGNGSSDIIIHLPVNLDTLGEGAFYNTPTISEFYMYGNVTNMPYEHPYAATSTVYKGILENVAHLTLFDSKSAIIMERMCMNDTLLETVNLPYVGNIKAYAFYGCTKLSDVTISSAEYIEDYAFYHNTSLKDFNAGAYISGSFDPSTTVFDTLIKSIGNYAFDGDTVLIYPFKNPEGDQIQTVSIGECAFRDCKYLAGSTTQVSTPENEDEEVVVTIVATGKADIVLPKSLTSIGSNAFLNDINIRSVKTPAGLTTIGSYVFRNCTHIQEITMLGEISGVGMFRGDTGLVNADGTLISIEKLTIVADEMFAECTKLKNIFLPAENAETGAQGLKTIGNFAFFNNKALVNDYGQDEYNQTIYVPGTVETIGSFAFYGNEVIKNIYIEKDSLLTMGASTFAACYSLEILTIPFVGYQQGEQVSGARVNLPYNINTINNTTKTYNTVGYATATLHFNFYLYDSAYNSPASSSAKTYNADGTSNVHGAYIPYSLREIYVTNETLIANYAFLRFWNVRKIELNEGITSIGQGAFHTCNNLISSSAEDSYMFTIPSTVVSIAADAFYECYSFVDVVVPNNVDSMGVNVFGACDNLETLSIPFVGNTRETTTASNNMLSFMFYTSQHGSSISNNSYSCYDYTYRYGVSDTVYVSLPRGTEYAVAQPYVLANNTMTQKVYSTLNTHYGSGDLPQDVYKEIEMVYSNPNWEPTKATTRWIPSKLRCVTVTDTETIYTGAFAYTNIANIDIAASPNLKTINDFAFYKATFGLTPTADGNFTTAAGDTVVGYDLIIPETVETVGRYVTKGSYVGSLSVPESVTSVGEFAFEDTEYLKTVSYASSVLNNYIFRSCDTLERFDQVDPSAISVISTYAFYNCYKLKYFNATEDELEKEKTIIRIKDTTTEIQDYAFSFRPYEFVDTIANPTPVSRVVIESSNTATIGQSVFAYQSGITSVDLRCEELGIYMFKDCINLLAVQIPLTATVIPVGAFYQCIRLATKHTAGAQIADGLEAEDFLIYNPKTKEYVPFDYYDRGFSVRGCPDLVLIDEYAFYNCRFNIMDLHNYLAPDNSKDSIREIGVYAFLENDKMTDAYFASSIYIIDERAFFGCEDLEILDLPIELREIGDYAFAECPNLVGSSKGMDEVGPGPLILPKYLGTAFPEGSGYEDRHEDGIGRVGVYVFANCPKIVDVIINGPAIGNYMFFNDSGLETVHANGALAYINQGAFDHCTSLVKMSYSVYDEDGYLIKNVEEDNYLYIPETVSRVESYAFNYCNSLQNVVLPEAISTREGVDPDTIMGEYVFAYNTKLEYAEVLGNILGKYMFAFDPAFKTIEISNETEVIPDGCFYYCTSLSTMRNPEDEEVEVDEDNIKVTLPTSVTTIGNESFRYCRGIKNLETPTTLTTIGDYTFADCDSLVNVDVKGNMLGAYMFYSDYDLTTVHLGDVETIPVGAFYRCFNLIQMNDDKDDGINEIILPDTVELIQNYAFALNRSFTNLVLPLTLQRIEKGAFTGCSNMTTATLPFIGSERGSTGVEGLFAWIYGPTIFYKTEDEESEQTIFYGLNQVDDKKINDIYDTVNAYIDEHARTYVYGTSESLIKFTYSNPNNYVTGNATRTRTLSTYDAQNNYREWINVVATVVETTNAEGTIHVKITFKATLCIRDEENHSKYSQTDITTPNDVKDFDFTLAKDYADVRSYYSPTNKVVYKFPAHLQTITILDEILVSYGAFMQIDSLENVVLNDTDTTSEEGLGIVEIVDRAFYNTPRLANVLLPSENPDFSGSLIELPTNLSKLGSEVFRYDIGITGTIVTPAALTEIGDLAFADVTHVNKVEIKGTILGDYMFARNYSLDTVDIIGDVVEISRGAFYNCTSLNHFDDEGQDHNYHFQASINKIDSYAFALNTMISHLVLPKTIETIEEKAFAGCRNIREYDIPFIGSTRYSEEREAVESVLGWFFGTEVYYKYYLEASAVSEEAERSFVYTTKADIENYLKNYGVRQTDLYGGTYTISNTTNDDGTVVYTIQFTSKDLGKLSYTLSPSSDMQAIKQMHSDEEGNTYQMPKNITSLTVYDDVVIGYGAAMNLEDLVELVLDPKITEIKDYAFYNDYSLEFINVYGEAKQNGAAILPTSIQTIGNYAFSMNTRETAAIYGGYDFDLDAPRVTEYINTISSIDLQNPTSIGEGAFMYWKGLTSLYIPESVTYIGDWAFAYNVSMTTVTNDAYLLSSYMFSHNKLLDTYNSKDNTPTIVVTNNEEYIDGSETTGIFEYCYSYKILSDGTKDEYGVKAFDVQTDYIPKYMFYQDRRITELDLSNYEAIYDGAFAKCVEITEINLRKPEGQADILTYIGAFAFQETKIEELLFPISLEYIGNGAIKACEFLKTTTIPFVGSCVGDFFHSSDVFGWIFGTQDTLLDPSYSYAVKATDPEIVIVQKETEEVLAHKDASGEYDHFYPSAQSYASLDTTVDTNWIPRNLKEVIIEKETVIARGAFSNCVDVEHIVLPENTIKEVLNYAFYNCASLKEMIIPVAIRTLLPETFNLCGSLEYLEIPFIGVSPSADGPESLFGVIFGTIPYGTDKDYVATQRYDVNKPALQYHLPKSLKSVKINAVTQNNIPAGGFENCSYIERIEIVGNVRYIFERAFRNCTRLVSFKTHYNPDGYRIENPEGDISLPDEIIAADYVNTVAAITDAESSTGRLPDTIVSIDEYAFENCLTLPYLILPASLETIGKYAFKYMLTLTSLYVPNKVTSFGEYILKGARHLETLSLPFIGDTYRDPSIEELGYYFGYVNKLTDFFIRNHPETNKPIYDEENYANFNKYKYFYDITNDPEITVDEFGKFSAEKENLRGYTIPKSLKNLYVYNAYRIQKYACINVESLENLDLSQSQDLEFIDDYAFYNNTHLINVYLPGDRSDRALCETPLRSTLKRIGNHAFELNTALQWIDLGAQGILTEIGTYSFAGSPTIKSTLPHIEIPSELIMIGDYAFAYNGLIYIDLDDIKNYTFGNYMFYDNDELIYVEVNKGMQIVGNYVFADCDTLGNPDKLVTDITLENGVILEGHPYNDNYAGHLYLEEGLVILGNSMFEHDDTLYEVVVPESVASGTGMVGNRVFAETQGLYQAEIKNKIVGIEMFYFNTTNSSLTHVTLNPEITTIGYSAFYNCKELLNVDLPTSEEFNTIEQTTFYHCESFTEITIPANVEVIRESAFEGCFNVNEVDGNHGLTFLGEDDNTTQLTRIEANAFKDLQRIVHLIIPDTTTYIGNAAFAGASMLEELSIPFAGNEVGNTNSEEALFGYIFGSNRYLNSYRADQRISANSNTISKYLPKGLKEVTLTVEEVVGYGAFNNCVSLSHVYLPMGGTLHAIDSYAFSGCTGLEDVVIPESVSEIGSYAFENCFEMTDIIFEGDSSLVTIGAYAFKNCRAVQRLELPEGLKEVEYAILNGMEKLTELTIPFVGERIGNDYFDYEQNYQGEATFGYLFGSQMIENFNKIKYVDHDEIALNMSKVKDTYSEETQIHDIFYAVPGVTVSVDSTGAIETRTLELSGNASTTENAIKVVVAPNSNMLLEWNAQGSGKLVVLDEEGNKVTPQGIKFGTENRKEIELTSTAQDFRFSLPTGTYYIGVEADDSASMSVNSLLTQRYHNSFSTTNPDFVTPETDLEYWSLATNYDTERNFFKALQKIQPSGNEPTAEEYTISYGDHTVTKSSTTYSIPTAEECVAIYFPIGLKKVNITQETRIGYGAFMDADMLEEINFTNNTV
ncbi:MAG: leucine-rich repeat domain-containing protein, partial [Anaeroplasmataceae bacterium]|nr:leucine-rich repeat domain-containing protein [Anaeroplasmataceae bacterium]